MAMTLFDVSLLVTLLFMYIVQDLYALTANMIAFIFNKQKSPSELVFIHSKINGTQYSFHSTIFCGMIKKKILLFRFA